MSRYSKNREKRRILQEECESFSAPGSVKRKRSFEGWSGRSPGQLRFSGSRNNARLAPVLNIDSTNEQFAMPSNAESKLSSKELLQLVMTLYLACMVFNLYVF